MITFEEFADAGGVRKVVAPNCSICGCAAIPVTFECGGFLGSLIKGIWFHCIKCRAECCYDIEYVMGLEVPKRTIKGWRTKR